ncbi:MAG TPA: UDP-glucose 4-epimerase, partial [Gemmatimonadaceae bacterium]|nr:UDP-glucose 4-epimerase [Gemmatimonadaceae bacterium]
GVETSVLDLARGLNRAAKATAPVEHAPARTGEQQRSSLVITKAAEQLGWRPTVSLDAGLAETFQYFARQRAPEAV